MLRPQNVAPFRDRNLLAPTLALGQKVSRWSGRSACRRMQVDRAEMFLKDEEKNISARGFYAWRSMTRTIPLLVPLGRSLSSNMERTEKIGSRQYNSKR